MDRLGLSDDHPAIPVFPDPRAVIADDTRRFRRLSPSERWQELFALHAWGALRYNDGVASPGTKGAWWAWMSKATKLARLHLGRL